MRKFPQPALLVFGLSAVLGGFWTIAKDSVLVGLDPQISWAKAQSAERVVAVTRLKKGALVASSTNGTNWEVQKIICGFNGVTSGHGKFVAVGESGAVGVSTNGVTWQIISIGTNELCTVHFQNGYFIATGCAPIHELFTSRDGFSWELNERWSKGEPAFEEILDTWVTGTNRAADVSADFRRQRGEQLLPREI